MWACVFPLCCPVTYILTTVNYGIELTGSNGWKLLDGKYFTMMAEDGWESKAVQLKHFYEKHQCNMQKLLEAIR